MNELAQLPTPTMATRTFSSWRPAPLAPFNPLVSLMKLEVLPCGSGWLAVGSGWPAKHTCGGCRLQVGGRALGLAGRVSPQLVPYVPYALGRRDRGQSRDSVDRRGQQLNVYKSGALGKDQADGKQHYPDGPGCQPHLALDPERLGAGPRVGDHQRAEHRQ